MLEAAPALQKVLIGPSDEDNMLDGVAFQPVIAALHGGIGLRNLKEIRLISCMLGDEHFDDFLKALGDSGIAERMMLLSFYRCEIGAEGAWSLAKLLRRDGLPGLQKLYLDENAIRDEGVVALAGGLREAPRTMLREFCLNDIGMGDVGMAALASLIYKGRLGQLEPLYINEIPDVKDEGITALARAISMRGLPKVSEFMLGPLHEENVTAFGFGALTFAFINNCPQLLVENITIDWSGQPEHADFRNAMVDGMLRAAGRAAKMWM